VDIFSDVLFAGSYVTLPIGIFLRQFAVFLLVPPFLLSSFPTILPD